MAKEESQFYSDAETARRRDATIKRMLATPPQPHKPLGKKKINRRTRIARKPRQKAKA